MSSEYLYLDNVIVNILLHYYYAWNILKQKLNSLKNKGGLKILIFIINRMFL